MSPRLTLLTGPDEGVATVAGRQLRGSGVIELVYCHRGRGGAGAFVLVQRCDAERRPLGSAVVAGPLREAADTAALCDWRGSGFGAGEPLPSYLRPVTVSGNS